MGRDTDQGNAPEPEDVGSFVVTVRNPVVVHFEQPVEPAPEPTVVKVEEPEQ